MENLKMLQQEIEELKNKNIALYNTFQYKMHKDEMQPLIEEWRENAAILREKRRQENVVLDSLRTVKNQKNENTKVFVNGYGEATKREITTTSYIKQQNRLDKQILNFIR